MDPTPHMIADQAYNLVIKSYKAHEASLSVLPQTTVFPQIQFLDAVSSLLLSRLQVDIISLSRTHNSGVPIHRLPLKILTNILRIDVQGRNYDRSGALTRLSLVCHLWKDAVQYCPRLWTCLGWGDPHNFIRTSLERSRGLALSLEITGRREHTPLHDLVSTHADRIRSICYSGPEVSTIQAYVSTVVDLDISWSPEYDSDDEPIEEDFMDDILEIGPGPSLRTLSLTVLRVGIWEWGRLTNLQVLKLEFIFPTSPSFSSNLLSVISTSLGLREIVLVEVQESASEEDLPSSADSSSKVVVDLPFLHSFHLGVMPPTVAIPLINGISARNCKNISLGGDIPEDLIFNRGWLFQNLCRLFQGASRLQIIIGKVINAYTCLIQLVDDVEEGLKISTYAHHGTYSARLSKLASLLAVLECSAPITLRILDAHPPMLYKTKIKALDILGELGSMADLSLGGIAIINEDD